MFFWLESTPLALWVSLSFWAYPVLLSVHIVGLSIVAGIYAMRDLRCLGVVSEPPLPLFVRFHRLALAGLALNVVSGFLLFSSQATVLIESVPFLIKMVCVGLASAIALIIHARFSAAIVGQAEAHLCRAFDAVLPCGSPDPAFTGRGRAVDRKM